ncbi:MAG: glutamate--cysteine ligase, partial [Candidatus Hydrogenedentes bacterium]|nr:glutamate--cysteine ligase [Candidatus Hydrogenedentota bacterium]
MSVDPSLHLFEGVGVELEYMIVDTDSLDVQPCADEVLKAVNGGYVNEVERGSLNWSNELALHVIELKTAGPAPSLDGLAAQFHQGACGIQGLLEPMHARLMPTAMHPWMDPYAEMKLWPHSASPIYEAFHR